MADNKVKRKLISAFKFSGLCLRSDASKVLCDAFNTVDTSKQSNWIEKVVESVQNQSLTSTFVSKDAVEVAIQECCHFSNEEESDKVFDFIDAYSIPKMQYNRERKKFLPCSDKPRLFGSAEDKNQMYKDRYEMLFQRTLHHELFMPAVAASSSSQKSRKFELKPVEHLLGCSGTIENVIVLGMLVQMSEGKIHIEDPSGTVPVDLTEALFHTGLFTENCFVLAEGTNTLVQNTLLGAVQTTLGSYDDQMFHVTALGFPPTESAKKTRSYFGNVNFFGGNVGTSIASQDKLKAIEESNPDTMFVCLSDVWLDDPKVMTKLRRLFSGYVETPPALFIMCGNFCSKPEARRKPDFYRSLFKALAELINEFQPIVESSRFLFVPGPQDPGLGSILPRPAIPSSLTEEFKNLVPFSIFATNPCRVRYCTQEIVVFREDIVNKMCRNCVHLPSDSETIPYHFAKTITSQGHLCPLPIHVRPVYWPFDYCLSLYPLPDMQKAVVIAADIYNINFGNPMVICADKYNSYEITESDCRCMNPGSFPRSEFCFKVYWPGLKEVDECKISD